MESLIRRRLTSDGHLCGLIARFGDEPAIFYAKAPADTDSPEVGYPSIVLTADKFSDAVHGLAGLLTVEIITSQDTTPPEDIANLVRELLEGVFFKPLDGEIFCLKWQKTDIFQEPASERMTLIIGAEMAFEIYEFPNVETSTPDPIEAINHWAAAVDPNIMLIGKYNFGDIFIPTRENPAVYFDVISEKSLVQQTAAVFLSTKIRVHVFAPDVTSRREWLTFLRQEILFKGHVMMDDGAPMRLQETELNFAANEIDGQLTLEFHYGLRRRMKYAHPLNYREVDFSKKLRWEDRDVYFNRISQSGA